MIAICLGITALVVGIDLTVKKWVETHVSFHCDKEILKKFGILRRVHNKGMMLNLGERYPNLVKNLSCVMTVLLSGVQILLLGKKGYTKEKLGLALVLGGAISNTYDRVKRGFVVDYFGFSSKNKKWSSVTYNIGDFAIFLGGMITLMTTMLSEK